MLSYQVEDMYLHVYITYLLIDYVFIYIVVKAFAAKADIEVETADISLASRIISQFPKYLTNEQRQVDTLAELGNLCKEPEANIIKLPNVSASLPQLNEAIAELRTKGYDVPLFVSNPTTEKERVIHARYAKVLGSAVNPVLREGNSDRRVAAPVKNYAKKNPHSMGGWSRASRSHIAHMTKGDFYESEKSAIMSKAGSVSIEHVDSAGKVTILKDKITLQEKEVIDGSFMSIKELRAFLQREIDEAYAEHMLVSLHLKATMMKVSDPVIFGHAVTVYYKDVFDKHANTFKEIKVNPNNGLGDVYEKIKLLPEVTKQEIEHDIQEVYTERPWLAMVDSAKGITNLHVSK
jgi:isocitrate dehydrogenase